MSQPQLYRKPATPGYLGGYNWPAVALGLLVLVLANFFCTQYIANRFQYQPALGAPLLRLRAGAIYQPFAWVVWGWQHMADRDPAIRSPFLLGMLIVLAGSFLSVGVFFAMTNRRARRLSMNAEDLHSSACWAAESDVRTSDLLTATDGVFVGGWSKPSTPYQPSTRWQAPALSPPQWPRAYPGLRSHAQRQRRGPGDSHLTGLVGIRHRLRHQGGELGQDRRLPRSSRPPLLQILVGRTASHLPLQPAARGPPLHSPRCERRAKHCRHDRSHRRRQHAGALLAGCFHLHHHRHDPACLLRRSA